MDIESVLAKHAKNYKKTVEQDEKTLYHLQINGYEAIAAMKEWAMIENEELSRYPRGMRLDSADKGKPIIIEMFADNGEHSHWELIDKDGNILWPNEPAYPRKHFDGNSTDNLEQ